MGIEVKRISKSFHDTQVLKDISLEVKSGELIALLGPSGSGKTTLLRVIAGLEKADKGSVIVNGEDVQEKRLKERNVGFVFQHYALFRHMTVFDNVAFGLKVRPKHIRPSDEAITKKVMDLLRLVHLDTFFDRYPHELSGGQRQRVALARALAVEPKVLLLDEPFGALDAKVRKELRRWMRRLHEEIHVTSIFVTHDQEEAMEVSDRVVVMSNGRIEQVGTPEEVYHHPANSFVYDFLGNYNEFDGWKDESGVVHLAEVDAVEPARPVEISGVMESGWTGFRGLIGKIVPGLAPERTLVTAQSGKKSGKKRSGKGKPVKLYARPHEMFISKTVEDHEYISTRVVHINPAGALVKLELERKNGHIIQAEIQKTVVDAMLIKKNDTLYVRPKNTRVFE